MQIHVLIIKYMTDSPDMSEGFRRCIVSNPFAALPPDVCVRLQYDQRSDSENGQLD